jgi:uncharacterized delta-60 repeat protein
LSMRAYSLTRSQHRQPIAWIVGLISLILLVSCPTSLAATPTQGTVDRSFGKRGNADTYFEKTEQYYDVAQTLVQADRRILVLARVAPKKATRTDENTRQVIIRLRSSGSVDKTFGKAGVLRDPLGPGTTARYAVSMALDGQGRLVLAGTVADPSGKGSSVGVARFKQDGSRDPAFAAGSPEFFRFDRAGVEATYSQGFGVSTTSNDGIVVGGAASLTGSKVETGALLKLMSDGQRDTQFGDRGVVFVDGDPAVPASETFVLDVLVRADDSIIASGNIDSTWPSSPSNPVTHGESCLIAKFDARGVADPQFGDAGQARLSAHYLAERCDGLLERADGGIFVETHTETGGSKSQPTDRAYMVNAQGQRLSYAGGSPFPSVPWEIRVYTASLFPAGAIMNPKGSVYVGFSYSSDETSRHRAGVIRLKPDGTRDARFSKNGISVLGTQWWQFLPADLARQDSKRIVVVGRAYPDGGDTSFLRVKRIWAR